MPAVTVLMTYRNAADFIDTAVRSVLAQTHQEWELLLIDDNLSGHEHDVAIPDPRIRRLRNPMPGRVNALRYGVSAARYNIIAILDADDVWHREKLACDVAALDFGHIEMVCWKVTTFQREPKLPSFKAAPVLAKISRRSMLIKNRVIQSTLTGFKRHFRYDVALNTSEDYELCLRLQEEGVSLWQFDQVGCAFRIHDSHFTRQRWRYTLASCRIQLRHILRDRAYSLLPAPLLRLFFSNIRHPLRGLQARLREKLL